TRRTDTADLFATAAAAPQQDEAPVNSDLFGGHNTPGAPTGEASLPAANEIFGGAGCNLFSAPAAQAAAPAAAAPRPARTSSPGFSGSSGGAMAAAAPEPAADAKMTG